MRTVTASWPSLGFLVEYTSWTLFRRGSCESRLLRVETALLVCIGHHVLVVEDIVEIEVHIHAHLAVDVDKLADGQDNPNKNLVKVLDTAWLA